MTDMTDLHYLNLVISQLESANCARLARLAERDLRGRAREFSRAAMRVTNHRAATMAFIELGEVERSLSIHTWIGSDLKIQAGFAAASYAASRASSASLAWAAEEVTHLLSEAIEIASDKMILEVFGALDVLIVRPTSSDEESDEVRNIMTGWRVLP